ncbi:MAG: YHS domain-containing (seleno)protein [Gemmatimonadaceae bacterium]
MTFRTRLRSIARRLTAVVALTVASATVALAQNGKTAVNVDDNGVILKGFDAVAFHTEMKPTKGSMEFTATHDGAIYAFASAANRDTFKADPAKYAPAFGGYCAMGVAVGKKLDVDPAAFTVANGKLFLNLNKNVMGTWAKDIAGNNKKAEMNWSKVAVHRGFDGM